MVVSLALLLFFLSFWLKNVYNEKYETLKKDTDYLFLGSIRSIEDELFEKFYGSPFSFKNLDSSGTTIIKIQLGQNIDTFNSGVFLGKEIKDFHTDSTHKLTIRSKISESEGKGKHIFGSLGLVIAIQKDSSDMDSLMYSNDGETILTTLQQYVTKDIQDLDVPLDYKIVLLDEQPEVKKKLTSSTYTDLMSGQSYAMEYERYRPYLIKKMIPEILFSLILFSCIALAFYVVYQSLQKQRRLTQLKNDFISNVTHELKTPITTVGVAIEALSNFEVLKNPERTMEYLDISKHELNRLSILVDKVLKMSHFEKEEPELKLEQLNMNMLIQDILDTMKLQFEKLNAKVEFQALKTEATLKGDKSHLTSVLYNLIDNALKYSSASPEINISLENSDEQIKLSIADKGIGIEAEYKHKVFEKFFRVPTGDKHNVKGYGLGLSYVASVVKKHKGSIEIESDPGKGTLFTIFLPKSHEQD